MQKVTPLVTCCSCSMTDIKPAISCNSSVKEENEDESTKTLLQEVWDIHVYDAGSINGRTLYDVEGNVLTNSHGVKLNIYTCEMKDAFTSGCLRLIHNISPGYRYFITKESQMHRFIDLRSFGADKPNVGFSVYFDDDFNPHYQQGHRHTQFHYKKN